MSKNIQIIAIILSICISCSSEPEINIKASIGKYNLANEINAKISEEHFFQDQAMKNINPRLGKALIEQLDSQKIYFTANEILYFTNKFQSSADDVEIATSYELINLYFNRLIEATKYQIKVIQKKDFDFNKVENISSLGTTPDTLVFHTYLLFNKIYHAFYFVLLYIKYIYIYIIFYLK